MRLGQRMRCPRILSFDLVNTYPFGIPQRTFFLSPQFWDDFFIYFDLLKLKSQSFRLDNKNNSALVTPNQTISIYAIKLNH